jgi:hypothetical protein
LEGERVSQEIPIYGLISDYRGLNAVMKIDALRRVLLEGETVSGAHLRIDQLGWSNFLESSNRQCVRAFAGPPSNRFS